MAHPYSTEARLRRYAAGLGERYVALLDRNGDGVADADPAGGTATTVADTLERAANFIDSVLGLTYVVPFSGVTGSPPEPAVPAVGDVCDQLALAMLYEWHDPTSPEAKALREAAEKALEAYRAKKWKLVGATEVEQTSGRLGVRFESIGTLTAGGVTNERTDQPFTDDTIDQTRGL